mgnify:CR=1 FL=1
MTGTKCDIYLRSKQKMSGELDVTEESYSASYINRNGKRYISYKRNVEDGEINCLISFDRKSLTMTQKGALNSKLELIPGKKTVNKYVTVVGALSLQLYTRHYQLVETKDSLKISLDYDIITEPDSIETSIEIIIKF